MDEPSRGGCLLALLLIFVPGIAASLFIGPVPSEEWPFALFHGVLLAIPFGYLALNGTREHLPWIVAIVLTICFWGAHVGSIVISAQSGSGVNIGTGLFMLASPILITLAAWIASRQA